MRDAMAGKSARNEQSKLTSVFLNNIGVAAVVTSLVGPIFSDHLPPREEMFYSILGLVTGIGLHLCARFVLRQVKD
jgi:hypothetical protein